MKNTGKASEAAFFAMMGENKRKDTFVYRFRDSAHINGQNAGPRRVKVEGVPGDYLVVQRGLTFLADVKSSNNPTSFPFGNIEKSQWIAAKRTTAAGGDYFFYLHRLATDQWYRVDAKTIIALEAEGKKSIRWDHMEKFECKT